MVNGMIPQSEICSPSASFVFQKVKNNLDAFDQMESSGIVRSLFGIGVTNPTAIDMNDGILSNQSDSNRYKLEQVLADGGISGIIWRFTSPHKFVIDLCKSWSTNGTRWTTLTLVTLVEKPNEPVRVKYRTLVQWKSDSIVFMSKSEKVCITSDFNQSDAIKKLHDRFKDELQKEASKQEQTEKSKSRIEFRGHPVKIEENKGIVEKFVEERHGLISPGSMTSLSEMCKWHVRVDNDPNDGHLIFTFPQYKFEVSFGELRITADVHVDIERKVEQFAQDVFRGECPAEVTDQFSKGLVNYLKAHDFIVAPEVGNPRRLSEVNTQVDDKSFEYTLVTVNLVTTEMETQGIKYRVEVFHDGTMKETDLVNVPEYLERHLFQNGNHEFQYECAVKALKFSGCDANVWSIDHQEELSLGEMIIKVKYERIAFPWASTYKFEAKGADFGQDLEAASDSLGKQIGSTSIAASPEKIVDLANGVLNVRGIKDYVVVNAELEGSDDLDDYASERTWILTFDMTPEAKETERLHMEEEKNKIVIKKDGIVSIIRDAEDRTIKVFNDETREEILSLKSEGLVENYNNGDRQFRALGDVTREAIDIIKAASWEFFNRFVPVVKTNEDENRELSSHDAACDVVVIKRGNAYYFRPNGRDENTNVDIISYHTCEIVTSFCDPDVPDFKFETNSYNPYVAKEDITPKMLKEKSLSEIMEMFYLGQSETGEAAIEPEKKENKMDKFKIEVADSLSDCKESVEAALTEILKETPDFPCNPSEVQAKLIEMTEIDDLKVELDGNGVWFVTQEEDPAEVVEEVPSADIHDQEVQLNLLRGLFGVTNPAVTHIQTFLRKHLTEIGHDGYAITETFPTETMIAWDKKPYNFAVSIVKMKDGAFYRIYLAYNNPGLQDQTWLATKNVPGRWIKIGNDIQGGFMNHGFSRYPNRGRR